MSDTQALSELDDDALMLLSTNGRKDAFEVLVVRYQAIVLGFACRFLNHRALGREVTQDVFLALWQERQRYRREGKLKAYILRCTYHRCLVIARKRKRELNESPASPRQDNDTAQTTPLETAIQRARAKLVHAELAKLKPALRQALVLRYLHDHSLEEVAETMQRPVGTVKSDVFRGLRALHRRLAREVL